MINILYAENHVTVEYAAREMKKYLDKVSGIFAFAKIKKVDALPKQAGDGEILLGYLSDFGLSTSEVDDPALDDVVDVRITHGSGYIAGSNERSILFGVYDYFKSMGCLWVRPGPFGEHLVACDPHTHDCTYHKKADSRFRGECIEGAPNYEHVRATVLFAPKVHMNLFMIQYVEPVNILSRWHTHEGNTYIPSEELDAEDYEKLVANMEKDIKMVGLQFHALGHGYITAAYGVNYKGPFKQHETNAEHDNAMALVKGKRGLYGRPSLTQFCMGNEKVMQREIDWLVDYAKKKPHIDFLHVWLGDGVNNHCECELCAPHHPSDLYVKMMNRLDKALTAEGIKTKVVFIAYTDTLWKPMYEKIENPDRFILTTAISASAFEPYDLTSSAETPKWERNKFPETLTLPQRQAMIRDWRGVFDGENFVFAYHNFMSHYNDPGTLDFCRCYYGHLHQVTEDLKFGGLMACQTQRLAFPTALGSILTGEALYDTSLSFEKIRDTYLEATYGEDYESVTKYLDGLTKLFVPKSLTLQDSADVTGFLKNTDDSYYKNTPQAKARLEKIAPYVDSYLPTIKAHLNEVDPCHARSYKILEYHAEYTKLLAAALLEGAKGNNEAETLAKKAIIDRMSILEPAIQFEFEMALFAKWLNAK